MADKSNCNEHLAEPAGVADFYDLFTFGAPVRHGGFAAKTAILTKSAQAELADSNASFSFRRTGGSKSRSDRDRPGVSPPVASSRGAPRMGRVDRRRRHPALGASVPRELVRGRKIGRRRGLCLLGSRRCSLHGPCREHGGRQARPGPKLLFPGPGRPDMRA